MLTVALSCCRLRLRLEGGGHGLELDQRGCEILDDLPGDHLVVGEGREPLGIHPFWTWLARRVAGDEVSNGGSACTFARQVGRSGLACALRRFRASVMGRGKAMMRRARGSGS